MTLIMAKTKNTLLSQVSGTFGGDDVFKRYYDKTVISKKPDMSNRVLSPKQVEWNMRMRKALAYVGHYYAIEEERIRARIRLKLPAHKSLFHAMVKEHLDRYKNTPLNEIGNDVE
jgi:hypothetical protein